MNHLLTFTKSLKKDMKQFRKDKFKGGFDIWTFRINTQLSEFLR